MLCSKGYDIPINNKSKVKVEVKIYFSSLRTLYNTFVIRLQCIELLCIELLRVFGFTSACEGSRTFIRSSGSGTLKPNLLSVADGEGVVLGLRVAQPAAGDCSCAREVNSGNPEMYNR